MTAMSLGFLQSLGYGRYLFFFLLPISQPVARPPRKAAGTGRSLACCCTRSSDCRARCGIDPTTFSRTSATLAVAC